VVWVKEEGLVSLPPILVAGLGRGNLILTILIFNPLPTTQYYYTYKANKTRTYYKPYQSIVSMQKKIRGR
jgi:hypothetical protein